MPSITADSVHVEEIRAELHSILQSQSFVRSPGLSRLLSYLCEKVLTGESGQIKEYSVALDVLAGRTPSIRTAIPSFGFRRTVYARDSLSITKARDRNTKSASRFRWDSTCQCLRSMRLRTLPPLLSGSLCPTSAFGFGCFLR